VDEGLAPADVRSVEAHLVGCERCRGLVLALREEARALGEILDGEAQPTSGPDSVVAPARGAALGLPVAIAATALATAVASALYEARMPMAWFTPSSLLGVNEMLIDTVFLVRDRAAGWFELALALGVLGGLAGIATFLAGALLRRYAGTTASAASIVVLLTLSGSGAEALPRLHHDETVRVARGETYEGTLAASCETLEIDGRVVGDVLAFCERVSVRGEVDGNLFVAAREIELDGNVTGAVIGGGDNLRVEGSVGGTAYLGGERVTVSTSARIGGDAFVGGERVRIDGEVARDLVAGGERVEVAGTVGRDLEAWGERVSLLAGSQVRGDVRAHMPESDRFEVAAGAVVGGTTDVDVPDLFRHTMWARYRDGRFYAWAALGFVASFLIGMVLYALAPRAFAGRLATGRDFFVSFGMGFAVLVLTPIAMVLTALTVVGIPAALIGLALWAIGLYLGGIVVAALIGRSLLGSRGDGVRDFGLCLLVGLAIVVLVKHLPFVGGAAGWVIALVGVGLLVLELYSAWQGSRGAGAAA
jgi:cytoskeletal protein CcmA (bactofilin family)